MNTVYIIAEAGVNHNGSKEMAFQLVDAALAAGADAVKFQTFKAGALVTRSAAKAGYQKHTTQADESQFTMLKKLELTYETHKELVAYCQKQGIEFLSTAFDLQSLDFLVHDLGLKTLKIPSGDITNGPHLLAHARSGCDLILSTGMSTLGEVEVALAVLAFGMLHSGDVSAVPSYDAFQEAYSSSEGQRLLKEKVMVLHCTTEYPAPLQEINLSAMVTMQSAFGLEIGYSDHSEGITVAIAAAAMGAALIEKHFTLDKSLPGPDHLASLEPDELQEMVTAIRDVEQAMGDRVKRPTPSELQNRKIARKSLVAACDIKKGESMSQDMLAIKRPGNGRSPMEYWEMVGRTSLRDYQAEELIIE